MNIKIIGEGKPVLFIHGYLESLTMWEPLALESAPWKSILIDLPGHGLSAFQSFRNFSELATTIAHVMSDNGFEHYDIVGHSLGGYVAIELHKMQLEKGKLILFHSNFWDDSEEKKKDRNRVIEIVKQSKSLFIKEAIPNLFVEEKRNDKFVSDLVTEALTINSESIIQYAELMRDRMDQSNYVRLQKNNTYFIYGERDHLLPESTIESHQLTDFICFKYKTGHMGHYEDSPSAFEILKKCLFSPTI